MLSFNQSSRMTMKMRNIQVQRGVIVQQMKQRWSCYNQCPSGRCSPSFLLSSKMKRQNLQQICCNILYSLSQSHYLFLAQRIHIQYTALRPIATKNNLSFSLVTTFVSISAGFWLVCIFSSFNYPSSNTDRMKQYLSYMCLVLE